MTELYDAALVETVPRILSKQNQVQALSTAWRGMMRIILDLESKTDIYTDDDALTNAVCDLLGGEWRIPQYSESYSLEVKRTLIKDALTLFSNAGTRAAVQRIVETIFGSADISEWFEYGGEPGYYMVETDNPNVGSDELQQFKQVAEAVKRKAAWLDQVNLNYKVENMPLYAGVFLRESQTMEFFIDGNMV